MNEYLPSDALTHLTRSLSSTLKFWKFVNTPRESYFPF